MVRELTAWRRIEAVVMTLPYDMSMPGRITNRPLGSIASVRITSNAGHSECVLPQTRARPPRPPDAHGTARIRGRQVPYEDWSHDRQTKSEVRAPRSTARRNLNDTAHRCSGAERVRTEGDR